MTAKRSKLWQCPQCGERFTTANQWHSCGRFKLDDLLVVCKPATRRLFDQFAERVKNCGPVTIIPQKTRVAFQVRMRFAAIIPRQRYLRGHFVLARRREESFFIRIQTYSPRNHVHEFQLDSEEQLTEAFLDCIQEAYRVGDQRHLDNDV